MAEAPAFRHSCLFALRGAARLPAAARARPLRGALPRRFPGIARYRFGPNLSRKAGRHALVLYSEFADEAAFRSYVASPLHDEIAAFLAPLVEETLIADIVC
jgi:hypothetical protein